MRSLLRPAVLAAILVCLATVVFPSPARADGPAMSVTLTSVDVGGTRPSSEVTLSGTVTNTGSVAAYAVQVVIWASSEQLSDVSKLTAANLGGQVPGERVVAREANYLSLVSDAAPFPAGATKPFTVKASLAEMKLATLNTSYVLGVDVRGNSDGSGQYQTLTRSRAVVPFATADSAASTAPLVLLTTQPSLVAGKVFANDHLAAELASGGRLNQLLAAIETRHLSYIIDTALLGEAKRMVDGYLVTSANGTNTEGTGGPTASAWLERFHRLPLNEGYRTLFALPDVGAAARLKDESILENAKDADSDLADRVSSLPLIVLPTGLAGDAATVAYLENSGARAIATSLLTTDATWVTGKVPLLRVSAPTVPSGVAAPLGSDMALAAEALLLSGSNQTQVRLLSSMDDIQTLDHMPSWISIKPLADVLRRQPATTPATYAKTSSNPGLSNADITKVGHLATNLTVFAQLAPKASTVVATHRIISRAASSAWVGHPDLYAAWMAAASRESTDGLRDGNVVLTATSKFLMSGRVNEFPITVTNNISQQVVVQIRLTSSNPQRLQVSDPAPITVDPRESRTVNIRPEATTNGVATVTAQLVTAAGTPVGKPIDVSVEATQYGVWGWVLVVASGLMLIGSTAWSLKKSRGRTRAEEAA